MKSGRDSRDARTFRLNVSSIEARDASDCAANAVGKTTAIRIAKAFRNRGNFADTMEAYAFTFSERRKYKSPRYGDTLHWSPTIIKNRPVFRPGCFLLSRRVLLEMDLRGFEPLTS